MHKRHLIAGIVVALSGTWACVREKAPEPSDLRESPLPPVAIVAPPELTRRDSTSGIVFDTLAKAPTMSPPPLQRTPPRPPTNTATASPVPVPRKPAGSAVTVEPRTPAVQRKATTPPAKP